MCFAELFAAIEAAISNLQPLLRVRQRKPIIAIEGKFLLSDSEGPFDCFDVWIEVDSAFPSVVPRVVETGGRLPRKRDRHVEEDGTVLCGGLGELARRDQRPFVCCFFGGSA